MSDKTKEYLWSSFVTFVAAFCAAAVPVLQGSADFQQAVIFAAGSVGVRAGFRAVMNMIVSKNI